MQWRRVQVLILPGLHQLEEILERGQAGSPQQRPQRRVAERRPVELAEVGVTPLVFQQQGIADVIQRRPILAGCQRPEGGAGKMMKPHQSKLSSAGVEGEMEL